MKNEYIPFLSQITNVKKHTEIEYTFQMEYNKKDVKPGQFFEISIPKFGEAPISVSGIGENTIDFTIRKVGRVTNEVFENYTGNKLFLRGPYGNGFDINNYKGKEIIIIAGGTGVSPVRGVIDYFAHHKDEAESVTLIAGFKSTADILFKDDFKYWEKNMNVILTIDKEEDGYKGNTGLVTKYIPELKIKDINDVVFIVVGPPIMMKFAVIEIKKLGISDKDIWISQERKMCCGIGKCGHCRMGDTYICLDGPVFNYVDGKNLID